MATEVVVSAYTESWVVAWRYAQEHLDRIVTDCEPTNEPHYWLITYREPGSGQTR